MEYICKYDGKSWIGAVTECEFKTDLFEIRVNGRESDYYVIVGSCEQGDFISIPSAGVSCPMGDHTDVFWNFEKLFPLIGAIDATTVAYGIREAVKNRNNFDSKL